MLIQKAFFMRLLRWVIFTAIIFWILMFSLRHNSYYQSERKWLLGFTDKNENSGAVDAISYEKSSDHLTFYKTLPQKDTKP